MTLYYFINYLVRRYIKQDILRLPEWKNNKHDSHIKLIDISISIEDDIVSDNQLTRDFSLLLRHSTFNSTLNKKIMYSELIHISHELEKLTIKNKKLLLSDLRYLFILYFHYMLNNPITMLIDDLYIDRNFYVDDIRRLLNKLT